MNTQLLEKTIIILAAVATIVSATIACQQAVAGAQKAQPIIVPCQNTQ